MNWIRTVVEPRIVEDWRDFWRWWSMRWMAVAGAVTAAWATYPEEIKRVIPPQYMKLFLLVLIVLSIAARVMKKPDCNTGDQQ
jgi:hypothetical protein